MITPIVQPRSATQQQEKWPVKSLLPPNWSPTPVALNTGKDAIEVQFFQGRPSCQG